MINNTGSPKVAVLSAREVAERAYAIYVERGRTDGLDLDDWFRAERELTIAPNAAPGKSSTQRKGSTRRATTPKPRQPR
jgi:DUF2934 family protein